MKIERRRIHFLSDVFSRRRHGRILMSLLKCPLWPCYVNLL